jgi:hypothetical protein
MEACRRRDAEVCHTSPHRAVLAAPSWALLCRIRDDVFQNASFTIPKWEKAEMALTFLA